MTDLPLPIHPISIDALQTYGVTDPQVRIYKDTAYLYASHDKDPASTTFVMPDWQLWTSHDLVNWTYETTLDPRQTHLRKSFDGCWAGDAICKDGVYYWCFSVVDEESGKHEIGIVTAPQPEGPWTPPLPKPWIDSDAADTHVYDPGFLQLENGELYIVFGVWDYYIARVADDMSGLAEEPRKIEIANPEGPYGKGKTDDKPFLHKRGERFYLSWGCFYATSQTPYGPYEYKGCLVKNENLEPSFLEKTWPHGPQQGRHGSFFDWKGQSYFMYCDMSFSGNRYYRGSWISYIHYRENGEIAPIEMTADAVGRYSATKPICAANYSAAIGVLKVENPDGSFSIAPQSPSAYSSYPQIIGLKGHAVTVTLQFSKVQAGASILVSNGKNGETKEVPTSSGAVSFQFANFDAQAGITVNFLDTTPLRLQLHTLIVSEDYINKA